MKRVLVYGMAVAGGAVARALRARDIDVVVADDRVSEAGRTEAAALGLTIIENPDHDQIAALLRSVDVVCPSPGVPEHHRVITAALQHNVCIRSELDVAFEFEAAGGRPRPMVAITGTDGKTTVTTLATEMVKASGCHAVAAGNTDVPLIEAIGSTAQAFVVEATSFRLRFLTCFAPSASTWLNLAPDHLDWHHNLDRYGAAKGRIFEFQKPSDVAIGFADDPVVMKNLNRAPARHITFAQAGPADYVERDGMLCSPYGDLLLATELWRAFPHDRTNALAAAATVLESGLADVDGVRTALRDFRGIPHRISLVAEAGGVRFYDDSKATTPHAALTALRGFSSVVLIAGGRNKDLDLAAMAGEPHRMRAVVAIGDSADAIVAAFSGLCPVRRAGSMDDAVRSAADAARPGDVVLLSPGCTSFDWYGNYAERGDDFTRAAQLLTGPR